MVRFVTFNKVTWHVITVGYVTRTHTICFIEYLKEADRLPLCEQKKTIKKTLFVTIHFER